MIRVGDWGKRRKLQRRCHPSEYGAREEKGFRFFSEALLFFSKRDCHRFCHYPAPLLLITCSCSSCFRCCAESCTGAKYERAPRLRKDAMLDNNSPNLGNSEALDAFRKWLEKDLQHVEGVEGTLESWLDAVRHFAQFIEPISLAESNYSEIGQFERELGRWHSGLRRFAEFHREVLRPKKQW
jgi:hypothetical protein